MHSPARLPARTTDRPTTICTHARMHAHTHAGRRISIDWWDDELAELDSSFNVLLPFLDRRATSQGDGDGGWMPMKQAVCVIHRLIGSCLKAKRHRPEVHELIPDLQEVIQVIPRGASICYFRNHKMPASAYVHPMHRVPMRTA